MSVTWPLAMQTFGEGLLVGFAVAMPVGPVAVVTIERTLRFGLVAGLAVGLGAALADTLLGAIAGYGLTFIHHLLLDNRVPLKIGGGIILIALGLVLVFTNPSVARRQIRATDVLHSFLSAFVITASNPITIAAFLAIFAGLGFTQSAADGASASLLIGGIFLGACLWWLSLSGMVAACRHRISDRTVKIIKSSAGYVIVGFGLYALGSVMI